MAIEDTSRLRIFLSKQEAPIDNLQTRLNDWTNTASESPTTLFEIYFPD